jgi:HAMP domain-containing protein
MTKGTRLMMLFSGSGMKVKLTVFTITLVFISLSILFAVLTTSESLKIREDLARNAQTLAAFSSVSIYQDYISFYTHPNSEDFENFRSRTEKVMDMNGDLASITLAGTNGRILFDSSELQAGKYTGTDVRFAPDAMRPFLKSDEVTIRDADIGGAQGMEIIVPIEEPSIGHVTSAVYRFSYGSLQARLLSMQYYTVLIFVPILLATMAISAFFSARLTRPISKLTEATAKISKGDLDTKIEIKSHDEIGKLSESFNKMTADLKKLMEENKKYSIELEKKVNERTLELEKSKSELEVRNTDLERFNKLAVGRELKMVELKKKIQELEKGGK